MRMLLAAALTFFTASSAWAADPVSRLVTESDTGVVFGDVDCRILSHEASAPVFSVDTFDYLRATVGIKTRCVTRDGQVYNTIGRDVVLFPTLDFDWADQAWYIGGVQVATLVDGWRVVVNPDLDFPVWTDERETHVSFRVEVRMPE